MTTSIARDEIQRLFATRLSLVVTLQRVLVGAIMAAHGGQKVMGWFGGYGYRGTMDFFTQTLHIPSVFAFLAILVESAGAIALLAGALTRLAALGVFVNMAFAVVLVHWPHGLLMNWFGNQAGEGFEYHLLMMALCVSLMAEGGGAFAIDGWIDRKFRVIAPSFDEALIDAPSRG